MVCSDVREQFTTLLYYRVLISRTIRNCRSRVLPLTQEVTRCMPSGSQSLYSDQFDMERRIEYWANLWQSNHSPWHKQHPHKFLTNHYAEYSKLNENPLRIFVPLCGKSIDLLWLYKNGNHVVGVEAVLKPILEFFEDNGIEYNRSDNEGLPCYSSKDDKIKIFNCNLFELSPIVAGKFHGIWDRGSLVAIPPEDRVKYSELMRRLLRDNFVYLLDTMSYNQAVFSGPPLSVPHQLVQDLFDYCRVKELERIDKSADMNTSLNSQNWKTGECFELCLLLKPTLNN